MHITQEKEFKPITIVLETAQEARTFIDCMDLVTQMPQNTDERHSMAVDICNKFSHRINLDEF